MMRYYDGYGWNGVMGSGLGMMAGWGIAGWISLFLFWTLIILAILALIRYLTRDSRKQDKCCQNHHPEHHQNHPSTS